MLRKVNAQGGQKETENKPPLLLAGTKITRQNSRKTGLDHVIGTSFKAQVISTKAGQIACVLKIHISHLRSDTWEWGWAAQKSTPLGERISSQQEQNVFTLYASLGLGWVGIWAQEKGIYVRRDSVNCLALFPSGQPVVGWGDIEETTLCALWPLSLKTSPP